MIDKEPVQLRGINTDFFSTLTELVCITDTENRIRYVNQALQRRLRPQQSKAGKPGFWELPLDKISAENTPVKLGRIYSITLKEWFELTIHYCEIEKGESLLIWIAKEIAIEKEAQIANTAVNNFGTINELYYTLFETSPSGILLLDEKGIIIDVNQSTCASTGYKPAELIGSHVRVLALPDNHKHIEANIRKILSGKTLKHEVTSLRKNGSFYYSLLIESAVKLPDGTMAILSVSNDITELKKAEFTLRERETWFRAIANHTANWESLFNFEGRIIWTNPSAERFTGYSPEEIIAMPDFIEELVARPDRSKAREVLALALTEKEGYEYFFRCIRKDGTFFWLSIAWTHLTDENDNLIGIRTSGQDVTLRLEALQALKKSESLYRHMIENAPFGMYFFEVNAEDELIFIHANPAADIILNQNHQSFEGKKIEEAFPLLIGSEAPQKFKEAALGNQIWITEKLRLNGLSGSMAFEVKAFQTAKGKMVAIFADISKRYQAEEQLRESRQLFETLARMAPVGIFRTNEAGDTTFVNPRWSALTGLSFSEALQNKYVGAIHPSDREERVKEWYYAVKHKIPVISEYRFVRPDGSVIWVQGQAIPETVDGQVKGYIGTITDITELIEIQDDLRAAKEKAEASNSLKTTFMKNLSHEIRTPLNGIFGFAQLIGSGDYSPEENEEFIGLLEGSISRMTKTIDNTMELSMLMTGNMPRNEALFNLSSLMHEVFRSFRPQADKKNLSFSLRSPADTGLMVVSDRMMLRRIVEEITDNAFKFTDKGKVTLDYKLEDDIIQIVVTDTGQGITPEYLPLIFEPFMQENVYSARAHNSPGLGLSIVHGLASLLGGYLKADSLLGKGTSISLRLPVRTTSKSIDASAKPPENIDSEKEPVILIVEDELINMLFVKRLLGKYKCKMIEATNGKEALAKVKKCPQIDIILMDIRMPGMDGFQAIELIRDVNPSLKIAAVTAYGSAKDREACLASGCVEYIAKPFNSKDLLSMLRRVIQWPAEN